MGSLLAKLRTHNEVSAEENHVKEIVEPEKSEVEPTRIEEPQIEKEEVHAKEEDGLLPTTNGVEFNGEKEHFVVPEAFEASTTTVESVEVDTSSEASSIEATLSKRKSPIDDERSPKKIKTFLEPDQSPFSMSSPDRPEKMYVFDELQLPCEVCKKEFPTEADRLCHKPCFFQRMGELSEPDTWPCQSINCNRSFGTLSHLKQHMATHFEGNFRCLECGFRAIRKDFIVKHTTRHLKDQFLTTQQSP